MADYIAKPTRPVTTEPGEQSLSQTAPLAGGGYVVAWMAWIDTGGVLRGQVVAQTFDAAGLATSAPLALFGDSAVTLESYALGGVSGLAGGGFVVSASTLHQVEGESPKAQVLQQRVDAQGHAARPSVVVAQVPYSDGSYPTAGQVHALADGGYFVEVDRFFKPTPLPGYQTDLHRYTADGAAVGAALVAALDDESFPRLAVLASGEVLGVGFRTHAGAGGSAIAWSLQAPDGTELASGTLQGTSVSKEGAPQVAGLADNTFLVVWTHQPGDATDAPADPWPAGSLAQRFDATGHPLGDVFAFETGVPSPHLLALADGGLLVWGPRGDAYVAQPFDAQGHATGSVFDIGPGLSSIAATADGGFLVSVGALGQDQRPDVYLREFDPITAGATLQGTPGNDLFASTGGDDTIDGGAGIDTVAYGGARAAFAITIGADGRLTVSGEGTDTLTNVERLHFTDINIAFDTDGPAGQAYRLYQAAFDRAPDLAGLGYHLHDLDSGVGIATVSAHFIESPEFASLYGPLDDTGFVNALYANVLHRAPDAEGLAFHLNDLGHGATRADVLVHFSESPENQAALIGDMQWGMAYVG